MLSRLVLIVLLAASQMLHEGLKQEHGRFRQSSWACLVKGHLRGSQRHQIRTAAGQMRALTSVPITQGKGIITHERIMHLKSLSTEIAAGCPSHIPARLGEPA
jgi:tryptophan synthase alpha subunit